MLAPRRLLCAINYIMFIKWLAYRKEL